jgi:Meiotically up-regulated gene 113
MRFYLRGPRIMGIGTGISFGPEDFRRENTRAQSSSNGGSFLYVITGDHERVKVGVSIDPNKRRAQLQTGSPFPLRIAYVAVTPGTGYDIEGEAKRTLDRYRCPDGSGDEWFNVPVEMAVAAINAAAFKRGQPLCQLTQEALDATLRVMALPEAQQQAFLAKGPFGVSRFNSYGENNAKLLKPAPARSSKALDIAIWIAVTVVTFLSVAAFPSVPDGFQSMGALLWLAALSTCIFLTGRAVLKAC